MRYCRHKNFGEVEAYELGWSPFGPPAMTVHFFVDEKIKDHIESLKKICQLDFDCLLCAHSPQINDGKTKLRNKLQFLEDIYGRIKSFHTNGLDVNATRKLRTTRANGLTGACPGDILADTFNC